MPQGQTLGHGHNGHAQGQTLGHGEVGHVHRDEWS